MKFNAEVLRVTCKSFQNALKLRDLKLPQHSAQDVWATLLFQRDYTHAMAYLKAQGPAHAVPVTVQGVRSALAVRCRHVDFKAAIDIFVDAVADELPSLSSGMAELVRIIRSRDDIRVIAIHSDATGLGIMDSRVPGYIPVSELGLDLTEEETNWLKHSDIADDVINAAGGCSSEQAMEIFAANHRLGDRKKDLKFRQYFGDRIDLCSELIAQAIDERFRDHISTLELDFDDIRDIIFDVLEGVRLTSNQDWLEVECDLGEAVLDHLAARLRNDLRWRVELGDEERSDWPLRESLAHTARLSLQKLLKKA